MTLLQKMKRPLAGLMLAMLAACAQIPGQINDQLGSALGVRPRGELMTYPVPLDALDTRDAQLREILAKTGALASKQPWSMTIKISGTPADAQWMHDQILSTVAPDRVAAIHFTYVTLQPREPMAGVMVLYSTM